MSPWGRSTRPSARSRHPQADPTHRQEAPARLDQAGELEPEVPGGTPQVLIVNPMRSPHSHGNGLLIAIPLFLICLILLFVRLAIPDWQGMWTESRNRLSQARATTGAVAAPTASQENSDNPAPARDQPVGTPTAVAPEALVAAPEPEAVPAPDKPDPTQMALAEIAAEAERRREEMREMERIKQEMSLREPRPRVQQPAPVDPLDWEAAQRDVARMIREDRTRQRAWIDRMAEMGMDPGSPLQGFGIPGAGPPPPPSPFDALNQGEIVPGQWPPIPPGPAPKQAGDPANPAGNGGAPWPPAFGLGGDPASIRRFDFQSGPAVPAPRGALGNRQRGP